MLVVGFFQWWYSRGWAIFAQGVLDRIRSLADFFSLGLLLRTLFYPFRQISAYSGDNLSLQQQLQAFFDKLLSRTIGAVVRIGILLFGIIAIFFQAALGALLVIIWPLIPLTPVISIALAVLGFTL